MQTIMEGTALEFCERKTCIICEDNFILLNCFMNTVAKVLLKCVLCSCDFFLLVRISEFRAQIPLREVYVVRISSKPSMTTAHISVLPKPHFLWSIHIAN